MSGIGDVCVGAETGLVKSVQLHNQNWSNLSKPAEMRKDNEICRMCWGDEAETAVLLGLRNHDIFRVDLETHNKTHLLSASNFDVGEGKFVGLHYDVGSGRSRDGVSVAVQSGRISFLSLENEAHFCKDLKLKKHQQLRAMRCSVDSTVMATGGLNEDLRLWDVNKMNEEDCVATFTAKNVKHDWLNLQVRVCVQDIGFLPESDKVITCTGYHQIRIYDPKAQRRPVIDFEFGEHPLMALSLVPANVNHVIVGNTQGQMSQHDLRMKGRQVHGFKGFAGGIRDIVCHPTEPLVASCGLDRFLRVHNTANHRLVNKVYLKSRLNRLLFRRRLNEGIDLEKEEEEEGDSRKKEGEEEERDEDEVWGKMEAIKDGGEEGKGEEEKEEEEEEVFKRKAVVTIVDEGGKKKKKKIK